MNIRWIAGAIVTLVATAPGVSLANEYEVIDLGPLSSNGHVCALNDFGHVVGQSYGHAFLWTPGAGMRDLGVLGGDHSVAYDINNEGVVVGSTDVAVGVPSRAFKWTAEHNMEELQTLGNQSSARGVNSHGEIAGLHVEEGNMLACYWDTDGNAHSAGGVGTKQQQSFRAINDSGVAAGFGNSDADGHHHAFTWTMAGGIDDLGVIAGEETHVKDISNSGVIVGYSNPGTIAYAWSETGGLQVLAPIGGQHSSAEAINGSGKVVGMYGDANYGYHAFLWAGTGDMVDVTPAGWTDVFAKDINDKGWIAGNGYKDGAVHGFLLIPEPATLSLLAIGGLAMLRRKRTQVAG